MNSYKSQLQHFDIIIVGGGPGGSSCAKKLVDAGCEVLVIDKAKFPRTKLCAGWITSTVMKDLDFTHEQYPHQILALDACFHWPRIPFTVPWPSTRRNHFSIRRFEFDDWLLQRSGAQRAQHKVKKINQTDDGCFVIDNTFSCNNLVGAGGTACPVRREFFKGEVKKHKQVATLEKEFEYPQRSDKTHMYFGYRGLQGYAWYVPKGNGFVNIGLGVMSSYLKQSDQSIQSHFKCFLDDLIASKLIDTATADGINESGHPYYLFSQTGTYKKDRCMLVGDAAGLASIDMAEGIGPAVKSGHAAAAELLGQGVYQKEDIPAFTFNSVPRWALGMKNKV